jgi:TonB family protein
MKRFFFISVLFHVVALLLLFSWEVPLADRLLPRSILEVSLVERIEKKLEGIIPTGAKLARVSLQKKEESAGIKGKEEIREVIVPPKEETKQEIKEEPIQKQDIEEKPKTEKKVPEEDRVFRARNEEVPVIQARVTPQGNESGAPGAVSSFPKSNPTAAGRGDSVTPFLASAGPELGKEGVPLGRSGIGSGTGRGEGGSSRLTSIPKSGGDGDPIIAEILRRIEAAKRYPRMARKMGVEGRAAVRFKLAPNGKVEAVELLETSGSEVLDQASLETVHRAAPLPYKDGWLRVVIVFKIL